MSSKSAIPTAIPGRRTPLSLSGAVLTKPPQQQPHQTTPPSAANTGLNYSINNKNITQKTEQQPQSYANVAANNVKDTAQKDIKKQQNGEIKEKSEKSNVVMTMEQNGTHKTKHDGKNSSAAGATIVKETNEKDNKAAANGTNGAEEGRQKNSPNAKSSPTAVEKKQAEKTENEKSEGKTKSATDKSNTSAAKSAGSSPSNQPSAAKMTAAEKKASTPSKGEVQSKAETATKSSGIPVKSSSKSNEIQNRSPVVALVKIDAPTNNKTATASTGKGKASPAPVAKVDENLIIEGSSKQPAIAEKPAATSTPGKAATGKRTSSGSKAADTEQPMELGTLTAPAYVARPYTEIGGRRSIRPLDDYTPLKFANSEFPGSYRRINTELDVSSISNTSINVTVGSERPNNSSFSFSLFGRGRKREHTPTAPHSQSVLEMATDAISSPKRARLDIFGVISSPLSILRSRFSKTSLQCSTPKKNSPESVEDEAMDDVQNVSGVAVEELISTGKANDLVAEAIDLCDDEENLKKDVSAKGDKSENSSDMKADNGEDDDDDDDDDEEEIDTAAAAAVDKEKNKLCLVM